MKTSQQWWNDTKASEHLINGWLLQQYTGEVTAAERIREFSGLYAKDDRNIRILNVIAKQEELHAEWIKDLLISRGINVEVGDPNTRYWKETLPAIEDFHTGAAIAAHAEKMRLERIRVISEDQAADEDIRTVFGKILKDELFHERAFREMSTPEAMQATLASHQSGMNALGLVA